ncbi:MAG TPA: ParB N-terminal domain-containing protein [Kofleriaceae bacterium]|jgi:ParB family chromosome partitioning protein|nr:ParB N-terminal domain-containing protein [Kofleriaceae bacterium]
MSPRAKSATPKAKPATTRKRKKKAAAGSVGLAAHEVVADVPPSAMTQLHTRIADAGGSVIAAYREPFGGFWVALAALPLAQIKPTPYQRELSKAHAEKLAAVIPKVGRFLDPVIAVADPDGDGFITPNGMHRLAALTTLGARTVIALVMPEPEIAFRILALNTEKAHNLKDKALEVIRMARAIAGDPKKAAVSEADVAFELEQAALVTLGVCYERNARFSGGAYSSIVTKTETFSTEPLRKSLALREAHAERLLELDEEVADAVGRLKASGFTSGYLKPIVVARINPLRFLAFAKEKPTAPPDFDKTIDRMIEGAKKFDPSKVRAQDVAIAAAVGGSGED